MYVINLNHAPNMHAHDVFNPRCACAARVTVVGFVCAVCLLSHISLLERLFILKSMSRTRATKVKKFVRFALKLLCCGDLTLPSSYGHTYRLPFFTHVRYTYEHTRISAQRAKGLHFSAFHYLGSVILGEQM